MIFTYVFARPRKTRQIPKAIKALMTPCIKLGNISASAASKVVTLKKGIVFPSKG
jgi:hypothetical protein